MPRLTIIILINLIFWACDYGLSPLPDTENEKGIITGTISYYHWPVADSLFDLRLIVFKDYPPENIRDEIINQNAIVHPSLFQGGLPMYVDSYSFFIEMDPGNYEYVVVAQQYGEDVMSDWRAVGQYDITGTVLDSIPTAIQVLSGETLENININVDFNNLPFQPNLEL